jgi:hypothetical protein
VKPAIWCIVVLCICTPLFAQTAKPKPKRPASRTVSASEVQALRDALAAQPQQMVQPHEEMEQLKSQLQQLLQSIAQPGKAIARLCIGP